MAFSLNAWLPLFVVRFRDFSGCDFISRSTFIKRLLGKKDYDGGGELLLFVTAGSTPR